MPEQSEDEEGVGGPITVTSSTLLEVDDIPAKSAKAVARAAVAAGCRVAARQVDFIEPRRRRIAAAVDDGELRVKGSMGIVDTEVSQVELAVVDPAGRRRLRAYWERSTAGWGFQWALGYRRDGTVRLAAKGAKGAAGQAADWAVHGADEVAEDAPPVGRREAALLVAGTLGGQLVYAEDGGRKVAPLLNAQRVALHLEAMHPEQVRTTDGMLAKLSAYPPETLLAVHEQLHAAGQGDHEHERWPLGEPS